MRPGQLAPQVLRTTDVRSICAWHRPRADAMTMKAPHVPCYVPGGRRLELGRGRSRMGVSTVAWKDPSRRSDAPRQTRPEPSVSEHARTGPAIVHVVDDEPSIRNST